MIWLYPAQIRCELLPKSENRGTKSFPRNSWENSSNRQAVKLWKSISVKHEMAAGFQKCSVSKSIDRLHIWW